MVEALETSAECEINTEREEKMEKFLLKELENELLRLQALKAVSEKNVDYLQGKIIGLGFAIDLIRYRLDKAV